jgi:DNA-binding MarR family transcriptional regulator
MKSASKFSAVLATERPVVVRGASTRVCLTAQPSADCSVGGESSVWLVDLVRVTQELANIYSASATQWLVPFGISVAECNVLMRLNEFAGATSSELAKSVGLTKGSVGRVVRILELKGMVETIESPFDNRAMPLRLIESGRNLAERIIRLRPDVAKYLVDGVDETDGRTAAAVLKRITVNLRKTSSSNIQKYFKAII